MFSKVILCGLIGLAVAQVQDDGDDGSYHAEKYEGPYANEGSRSSQPAQYSAPRGQQSSFRPGSSYTDHKNAAILSEARYLSGDGKFGASYSQDDGVEFKEETEADGTRRGTYSYVDPSGQRRTVSYTAGKNGFQASGDHLPVASQPAAPQQQYSQPAPQPQYRQPAPQPQYSQPAPQPQYRQPAPQPQYSQPAPQPQYRQPAPQQQYRQPAPQPQYSQPAPQPQYRQPAPQQQYRPSAAQYSQPAAPQYSEPDSLVAPQADSAGGYTINASY